MTLRQVWRFLRDCQVVSATSTLAQFDRLYNAGTKNHFTLLGCEDKDKFDYIYEVGKKPAADPLPEQPSKVSIASEKKKGKKKLERQQTGNVTTIGAVEDFNEEPNENEESVS